jgi:hypothetical protein
MNFAARIIAGQGLSPVAPVSLNRVSPVTGPILLSPRPTARKQTVPQNWNIAETRVSRQSAGPSPGSVIPAKAGTSGQEVSVGLPEVAAFAGMTKR